jgi:hypothetical protein
MEDPTIEAGNEALSQRAPSETRRSIVTIRKSENLLRGDRTPAYVSRETGAAELQISADTWDQWVKEGRLPPASDGFPAGAPRWRWEDVDRKLSGRVEETVSAAEHAEFLKRVHLFGKKKRTRRRIVNTTPRANLPAGVELTPELA